MCIRDRLSEVGRKLMSGSIPRADAKVATKGRVESLMLSLIHIYGYSVCENK